MIETDDLKMLKYWVRREIALVLQGAITKLIEGRQMPPAVAQDFNTLAGTITAEVHHRLNKED
jgi:hypothetical protein